jgi:hypothetical protein
MLYSIKCLALAELEYEDADFHVSAYPLFTLFTVCGSVNFSVFVKRWSPTTFLSFMLVCDNAYIRVTAMAISSKRTHDTNVMNCQSLFHSLTPLIVLNIFTNAILLAMVIPIQNTDAARVIFATLEIDFAFWSCSFEARTNKRMSQQIFLLNRSLVK